MAIQSILSKYNHLLWQVFLIIPNMPKNLSIKKTKYILTTFFSCLPKEHTSYILLSFLYAPNNIQQFVPDSATWISRLFSLGPQECTIAIGLYEQEGNPFFPSRQLLSVKCCLAGGNHITAGRGENWQSIGELGLFCFVFIALPLTCTYWTKHTYPFSTGTLNQLWQTFSIAYISKAHISVSSVYLSDAEIKKKLKASENKQKNPLLGRQ